MPIDNIKYIKNSSIKEIYSEDKLEDYLKLGLSFIKDKEVLESILKEYEVLVGFYRRRK